MHAGNDENNLREVLDGIIHADSISARSYVYVVFEDRYLTLEEQCGEVYVEWYSA